MEASINRPNIVKGDLKEVVLGRFYIPVRKWLLNMHGLVIW